MLVHGSSKNIVYINIDSNLAPCINYISDIPTYTFLMDVQKLYITLQYIRNDRLPLPPYIHRIIPYKGYIQDSKKTLDCTRVI